MPRKNPLQSGRSNSKETGIDNCSMHHSLLILECDTNKLINQGIRLGRNLFNIVKALFPAVLTNLVSATTSDDLLKQLGDFATKHLTYQVIVVVGHSNILGLALTSDRFATWKEFTKWISPFNPEVIVLACCEGGRWLPSRAMFDGVDTLQEIYGTPIPSTEAKLQALNLLVLYLMAGGRVDIRWLQFLQITNLVLTGGLIFRQTREEMVQSGLEEGLVWTVIEEAIHALNKRSRS